MDFEDSPPRSSSRARSVPSPAAGVEALPAGFAWISSCNVLPGSLSSCACKPPRPPRRHTGKVSEGSLSSPPELELHFTLDFYSAYEFHLTLLGSPRELTAQATVHPLDLYSKYEFHFTLRSYLSPLPDSYFVNDWSSQPD